MLFRSLEPVDHSTSFATDDTEIIPLQPQTAPAGAGRRRATRPAANPFVRRLPSLPLVAGVAVLGLLGPRRLLDAHHARDRSHTPMGDVARLLRHRPLYPIMAIQLLWQFSPAGGVVLVVMPTLPVMPLKAIFAYFDDSAFSRSTSMPEALTDTLPSEAASRIEAS